MNLFIFQNNPIQTAFAPQYNYLIADTMIEDVDFENIGNYILDQEMRLIEESESTSIDSYYTGLNAYSLTSRALTYNVFNFDNEEVQKLKQKIFEHYIFFLDLFKVKREKVFVRCWANVLRYEEEIKPHLHSVHEWSYLSGHVTVKCKDTRTCYINPINQLNDPEIYAKENKVGELTIFQSNIPHYTTKHMDMSERITIAFDLVPEGSPVQPHDKHLVLFDSLQN